MPEKMQPCKTADQKVHAKEIGEGGPERIYGLGFAKRCSSKFEDFVFKTT